MKPTSLVPSDQPGNASAEAGIVLLDGPGNIAAAMTPEAAQATAEKLLHAAELARRQALARHVLD